MNKPSEFKKFLIRIWIVSLIGFFIWQSIGVSKDFRDAQTKSNDLIRTEYTLELNRKYREKYGMAQDKWLQKERSKAYKSCEDQYLSEYLSSSNSNESEYVFSALNIIEKTKAQKFCSNNLAIPDSQIVLTDHQRTLIALKIKFNYWSLKALNWSFQLFVYTLIFAILSYLILFLFLMWLVFGKIGLADDKLLNFLKK